MVGRKITLKYEGRCLSCGKMIPIGTRAYWESGKGIWHLECTSPKDSGFDIRRAQSPRTLSRRVMALTVVLVVSALVLGLSLGNLGRFWWYQPPVTTPTVTVTVTSGTGTTTITSETSITLSSPRKWINPDAPVISYLDAKRYVGQVKTVEGKIVRTYRYDPGNVIFLNFRDPYEGYFTVIIWRENWKDFQFAPEVFYKGKEVRVTGLIKDYQGTPQIEVTSPKQIEVAYMGFSYPAPAAPSAAFCIPVPVMRMTRA